MYLVFLICAQMIQLVILFMLGIIIAHMPWQDIIDYNFILWICFICTFPISFYLAERTNLKHIDLKREMRWYRLIEFTKNNHLNLIYVFDFGYLSNKITCKIIMNHGFLSKLKCEKTKISGDNFSLFLYNIVKNKLTSDNINAFELVFSDSESFNKQCKYMQKLDLCLYQDDDKQDFSALEMYKISLENNIISEDFKVLIKRKNRYRLTTVKQYMLDLKRTS